MSQLGCRSEGEEKLQAKAKDKLNFVGRKSLGCGTGCLRSFLRQSVFACCTLSLVNRNVLPTEKRRYGKTGMLGYLWGDSSKTSGLITEIDSPL